MNITRCKRGSTILCRIVTENLRKGFTKRSYKNFVVKKTYLFEKVYIKVEEGLKTKVPRRHPGRQNQDVEKPYNEGWREVFEQ